ncbi:MAG: ADP-ribosylglycohydrolase family protein [Chloroflexi bacterium]|nr:ADP-ribosylglycohydrolase family protein [Chloroflexota bacterium]
MAHIDGARGVDLLVGLALGDAFGAPVEFERVEAIAPQRDYLATFPGGGIFDWSPGEFTDDTQMALVLARHLLEQGHVEHQLLAESFAAWAADSADVGMQTRAVLTAVREGRSWREAVSGLRPDAAGNGSLMRVAPVVLLGQSRDAAMSLAVEQSRVTHPNPLCREACRIYVALLWDTLAGSAEPLEAYAAMATLPEVGEAVRRATVSDPPTMSGFVLHTLTGALWAVREAESFADAVWLATSLGRDADTVAAVAGALAAITFTGAAGIPDDWRLRITSKHPLFKGWSAVSISSLSVSLMERGAAPA